MSRAAAALLALALIALVVSSVHPYDRATWFMEVAPIFIAAPIMIATYRRFALTDMLYMIIAVHALVLIFGGAYTYARVPLGDWLERLLALDRNPYDRIGHFMQGLTPALLAREIFLRGGYVAGRRMTAFLCVCVAMTVSACYELIEWWAALALGQGADAFLGTQGDPWDTQGDMFSALIGSIVGLAAFSRLQDVQIRTLQMRPVRSL
jgi:putative membrane protein